MLFVKWLGIGKKNAEVHQLAFRVPLPPGSILCWSEAALKIINSLIRADEGNSAPFSSAALNTTLRVISLTSHTFLVTFVRKVWFVKNEVAEKSHALGKFAFYFSQTRFQKCQAAGF